MRKIYCIAILTLAISLNSVADDIVLTKGVTIPFGDMKVEQSYGQIITNGERYIVFKMFGFYYLNREIVVQTYLNVNQEYKVSLDKLKEKENIDEVFHKKDIYLGISDQFPKFRKMSEKFFDDIVANNGLHMVKFLSHWASGMSSDILAYKFKLTGFYDECIVQFYNIWGYFHEDHRNDLNLQIVKNYTNRNDSSIKLYDFIDEHMKEIKIDTLNIETRYGVLNDSRVRIREAPDLQGKHIGYLDKDQRVEIVDQTDEKMKIGDMEAVWYKIRTENGVIGWVYGWFIDVLEK